MEPLLLLKWKFFYAGNLLVFSLYFKSKMENMGALKLQSLDLYQWRSVSKTCFS